MLSLEEREIRRKQLGASEIYKILNFDTEECQDLWELKIGLQDYQELDNDAITAGNLLEEDCLKYYSQNNKMELIYNERIEHKDIPGLVVSLDARRKDNVPVENKVINEKSWEKWIAKKTYNVEYDGIKLNIPKSYYCQVQIQMCVCESQIGILNVNKLTDEEQEDPINVEITFFHNEQVVINRDDNLIKELEKRAKYFLHCMKYKIRPSENDYLEKNVF